MQNLIGQPLGRYLIQKEIGIGGMSTVYRAYDTNLEREVAIKVIRREAFPEDDVDRLLKRFEREAKVLARLVHPNIVVVIDYGCENGTPYLVMNYLPGGTLAQMLDHPMPWQDAVRLLTPIARALEFAHGQNIIHRDIKPSNILLSESGDPMLVDFGIAKILDICDSTHLTISGVVIGTPHFMAPEQWSGVVSPQSDIYSLGGVLYQMVTGRFPFTAETPAAVFLKQANDPLPSPRSFVPDLPDEIERILVKALAKEPEDRFEDMSVFVNTLQQLIRRQNEPLSLEASNPWLARIPKLQPTHGLAYQAAEEICADESIRNESHLAHVLPFVPACSVSGSFYDLPVQLTPLIGRDAQLERLVKLLFSYRWVTLVGEGGIGKSRLAITAAEKVAERFPDGVLFLPLAGVGPTYADWGANRHEHKHAVQESLLWAIGAAFNLPLYQDDGDFERLCAYLQPRKTLLILDSFEHLSSGSDLLLELLTRTPQLHLLVTTRQSIYFQAGCLMRIDGLPVPQEDRDPDGEQYASVQLFLERVMRLYSDYRPTRENQRWISRICRLLDGIPLAIELVAPWVNKLPLEVIAHSIEHDLDFLTNTMPGLLERHHSMRAVFESSWMLLKAGEKWALARCSAFKNVFSSEEVFELGQVSFQDIEGLVDKNLVIKVEPGRYRMHEILRQFVMEKCLDMQPVESSSQAEIKKPAFHSAASTHER